MQEELEELEKKYSIDWREYRLGDIFEFEAIKQAKSQRDIPADNSESGVPYIVQSVFNNMFSRNVNKQWLIDNNEAPVSGNRIVLGVTLPAVSYQPREFGASQVITAKADWLNSKNGLFFATAISKQMYQFSYGRKPGLQIYKDIEIQLPTQNEKIAFDYIEEFIAMLNAERIITLEAERNNTLNAYLIGANLQNYTLTKKERETLENLENVKWHAITFDKLFSNIQQGARLKKADQIDGDIPFIMAGTTNTGVVKYISNPVRSFPKNSLTIDIFGNTFYRDYSFGAGDDTGVFWNDDNKFDKYQMLFLAAQINKALAGRYDFGNKLRASQTANFEILLPVKSDLTPDFGFMETYIKAMQKVVIKNVVEWANKRIEATKKSICDTKI